MQHEGKPDESDQTIEGQLINIVDPMPDINVGHAANVIDLETGAPEGQKIDADPTAEQMIAIQANLARSLSEANPDDVLMIKPKGAQ